MAQLSTGIIENTIDSLGARPSSSLAVRIANDDAIFAATVLINGYFLSGGTKTLYVQELLAIAPGNVVSKSYFAALDAIEFQFDTSSDSVETSVWGKNSAGELNAAHRIVPAELDSF